MNVSPNMNSENAATSRAVRTFLRASLRSMAAESYTCLSTTIDTNSSAR